MLYSISHCKNKSRVYHFFATPCENFPISRKFKTALYPISRKFDRLKQQKTPNLATWSWL